MNYLLVRDELQQNVVEKDRLMTDFCHIHQRSVSIFLYFSGSTPVICCAGRRILKPQSYKVEQARQEKQDEMLELIRSIAFPSHIKVLY